MGWCWENSLILSTERVNAGSSLAVQWSAVQPRVQLQPLVGELRSHMSQGVTRNIKEYTFFRHNAIAHLIDYQYIIYLFSPIYLYMHWEVEKMV